MALWTTWTILDLWKCQVYLKSPFDADYFQKFESFAPLLLWNILLLYFSVEKCVLPCMLECVFFFVHVRMCGLVSEKPKAREREREQKEPICNRIYCIDLFTCHLNLLWKYQEKIQLKLQFFISFETISWFQELRPTTWDTELIYNRCIYSTTSNCFIQLRKWEPSVGNLISQSY